MEESIINKRTLQKFEKLANEIIDLLNKYHSLDNLSIKYGNKTIEFGSSDILIPQNEEEDFTFVPGKRKEYITDEDNNNLRIIYDGGYLYDIVNGTYDWNSWNKLESNLNSILRKYNMEFEHENHYSLVIQ